MYSTLWSGSMNASCWMRVTRALGVSMARWPPGHRIRMTSFSTISPSSGVTCSKDCPEYTRSTLESANADRSVIEW